MLGLALALSMSVLVVHPGGLLPFPRGLDRAGTFGSVSPSARAKQIVFLRLDRTTRSRLETASSGLPLSSVLRGLTIHIESAGGGSGPLRLVMLGVRYRRGRRAWEGTSEPFEVGPGPTPVPFDRLAPILKALEDDPVIGAPDFIIDGILIRRPDLLPPADWLHKQAGPEAEDVLYLVAVTSEQSERDVGSHPVLVRLDPRGN